LRTQYDVKRLGGNEGEGGDVTGKHRVNHEEREVYEALLFLSVVSCGCQFSPLRIW
jgi:hypothetical protein